ncbi:MAG: hypothetical protein SNJ52_01780, partial [Verrucomicrobiia bacterium]
MTVQTVLEAILFASQKPLHVEEFAGMLRSASQAEPENADAAEFATLAFIDLQNILQDLRKKYDETKAAFRLVEVARRQVL